MKKLIVITTVIFSSLFVNAQKHTMFLGGNVDYTRTSITDQSDRQFTVAPVIGYHFTENFAIGARTGITDNKVNSDLGNVRTKGYEAGGFFRFICPFNNTFAFFTDLGGGYTQTKVNTTSPEDGSLIDRKREYGYYVDLTPYLSINFKNNFALNFSIGGISYKDVEQNQNGDYENKFKNNKFSFDLGKAISIGVQKTFEL